MSSSNFSAIESLESLQILVTKLLAEGKPIGFDVETGYYGPDREKGAVDIDWDEQFVCGFSITNGTSWARYVPVAHDFGNNLPEREAWEIVKPALETLPVVAHNAKFEIRNLRALERKGRGPRIDLNIVGDSMLDSYILSETPTHGLKELVKVRFRYEMATIESLFPNGLSDGKKKKMRFNVLELSPDVISYACDDAVWTLKLWETYHPKVIGQRKFMWDLERATLDVLCDVEDGGHAVDWESLNDAYAYAEPFHEAMQDAARTLLGELAGGEDFSNLNLNSTPQMRAALYEKIGLRTTRVSKKTGALSTDKIALEKLSRDHPAVKKVLEAREVKNLLNRLKKWSTQYAMGHDGRVHASFNQVVVASGRFSANDPAVQQLPKEWRWTIFPKVKPFDNDHWKQVTERAVFGKHYWQGNFRDFMVSAPGTYLLGFDYSQIELRCLAGMSQEPALLEAFNNDVDIHKVTAAMMLGKSVEEVTEKDRAIGKTMNFALLYGMGADSLADRLALDIDEAERLYAQYFSAFTKVTGWMELQKNIGKNYGFVETHFKRKVTIWDLQSSHRGTYGKGERLCVNAPVQGTAADMMKVSMIKVRKTLIKRGWWMTHVRMTNNIHDALVFEVDNSVDPNELREILHDAVVWPIANFPKVKADWELGHRWGSGMVRWKDEVAEFVNGEWTIPIEGEIEEKEEDLTEEDFVPDMAESIEDDDEAFGSVVVELIDMPSRESMETFVNFIRERPGGDVVTLKTPEGMVDLLKYPTALSPDDQPNVSFILGGAKVYYPDEDVDESMLEGLEL